MGWFLEVSKIFTDDRLTQSVRVMMDPDSTIEMKNMARLGGFIDTTCTLSLRSLKPTMAPVTTPT